MECTAQSAGGGDWVLGLDGQEDSSLVRGSLTQRLSASNLLDFG